MLLMMLIIWLRLSRFISSHTILKVYFLKVYFLIELILKKKNYVAPVNFHAIWMSLWFPSFIILLCQVVHKSFLKLNPLVLEPYKIYLSIYPSLILTFSNLKQTLCNLNYNMTSTYFHCFFVKEYWRQGIIWFF